jgi:hypothetical protein
MFLQFLRYIHSQWTKTQCECKRIIYVKKGKKKKISYCMYCIRPKYHFGKHMDHHAVHFDTEKEI